MRKNRKHGNNTKTFISIVIVCLFAFVIYQFNDNKTLPPLTPDGISVHFINVGQGDSALIKAFDTNILVDAGPNIQSEIVPKYLRSYGVERIDLLVATHPHADHIGGMAAVVSGFEIGEIVMPELPYSLTPTTKTYRNLLDAIAEKELSVTIARQGLVYTFGEVTAEILGPVQKFADSENNNSAVIKVTYDGKSVLIGGDIEKEAENALIESGQDLRANILKISHHGSNTSSTVGFLDAVRADFFVISCGNDNQYGHPHAEVIARLERFNKLILRTDLYHNIIFDLTESISVFHSRS
ncbi:MAG: MBL fold metallo-hydrolase [Oscillospiraceae bacterium]|nr:MBL fold metallo-hydrolase [Oscillospiraceae bacterium]